MRSQRRLLLPSQALAISSGMGQHLGQRSFVYKHAGGTQDAADLPEGVFGLLNVIASSEVDDQVE